MEVGNFALTDCQIPIKDVQKLALDPTGVTFPEDSSCDRPPDVLSGRIIRELESWPHPAALSDHKKTWILKQKYARLIESYTSAIDSWRYLSAV